MTASLGLRVGQDPVGLADWRRLARRKLPHMVWEYLEGGAGAEITRRANTAAFSRWRLIPRVLRGHPDPDLSCQLAGQTLAMPVAMAPVGLSGLLRWNADPAAARATEELGTRMVLSTASSWSLEEVAGAATAAHWFQLYPYGDRAMVCALVDRAQTAGYGGLFVTVDATVRGDREREMRGGLRSPLVLTPRTTLDLACHPLWSARLLRHRRMVAIHYAQARTRGVSAAAGAVREMVRHMQGTLNWDDLAWLRDRWQGPLFVKGVLHPDDAFHAIDRIGADGVVVSNHGGRQLDRVPAALDALPGIVDAVGGRGQVCLDGGIRRGSDVVIALALGATAVFAGRALCYGLAAAGQAGAEAVLKLIRDDVSRTLSLVGCPCTAALDRSWLEPAP